MTTNEGVINPAAANSPASAGAESSSEIPPLIEASKNRFLLNVGSNICFLVINTGLMIWYVPFLVHNLGVAAYGMIPLANSLVLYAAIVSTSLDVSVGRYLAIDMNQQNLVRANRTFNTAVALSIAGCLFLSIPAGAVTYFFPILFNVPAGLELATQFMFVGVTVTTLAAILSGSFGVSSLIMHRFDLRNAVRLLTSLSRIGIVAACFMLWPASLWHVTIGFIVSAFIGLTGDILLWRHLTPQLRIDYRDVDHHQFRALMGLSGWSAVNQVGSLLLMQIDLLIINSMYGPEMTGRYGSVLFLPGLIHMMVETVATVINPAILTRYAVGDVEGLRSLAVGSIKFLGLALALPVGLLCGFGRPLLSLWLGPDFATLDTVLVLLTGHLAFNLAARPLSYVLTAYNRVRVQGLVTLGLGAVNVGLAILLAGWAGWGMLGVAAAAAMVWTLKNVIILSSYSAVVMNLRWWTFYPPLAAGAVGMLVVALTGRIISHHWWPGSWLSLGLMAGVITLGYVVVAYTFGLSQADRVLVWSYLRKRSND